MKWNLIISSQFFVIFSIFIEICYCQNAVQRYNRFKKATENCPEMIGWDSLYPKESFYITYPAEYVVIHHTMGLRCFNSQICKQIVQNIQLYSMQSMTFPDIKYNFLIGEDGNVYEGTGWFRSGFHTSDEIDSKSVSIGFIGDFTDSVPIDTAMEKLQKLLKCGVTEDYISKKYKLVVAFQIEKSTMSPGKLIFEELKKFENFVNNENDTM